MRLLFAYASRTASQHDQVAPPFLAVGLSLLYSINGATSSAKLAESQIVLGASTDFGMQNSIVAIQVEFKDRPKLFAQAQSVSSLFQFLAAIAVYTDLPEALVPGVIRASIESLHVVSILGVPVDGKQYAINI
ncbi:hypothetical protein DFH08DRAFT_960153 [Mycena albidolilacea]|uniref:Uncharacterized protein n=1 Tax=Mycena albidolilacea TaxID=1033008 RepID=A0AAD7A2U3_9AGAR|nr:hypothetical protein DFH08DRAFT_960153 [Mycena albidolilacea]